MRYNDFIKAKRQAKGLSLRAVGEKAGVSHNFVKKVEDGVHIPGLDVGLKLLLALDVPVGEFLKAIGYPDISTKAGKKRATGFEPATFSLGS